MHKDWISKLSMAAKSLKNLMPEIRDPQLQKAVELVESMEGMIQYSKFRKGDTFESEEILLEML